MKKPVYYMFQEARVMLAREFSEIRQEFNHMDVFGYNQNGDCCEIEVKVADYDFYKEWGKAGKVHKHKSYRQAAKHRRGFCPNRFYFMVMTNLEERAIKKLDATKSPYGLITYNSLTHEINIVRKSEKLTDKPFDGEISNIPYKEYSHGLESMC